MSTSSDNPSTRAAMRVKRAEEFMDKAAQAALDATTCERGSNEQRGLLCRHDRYVARAQAEATVALALKKIGGG